VASIFWRRIGVIHQYLLPLVELNLFVAGIVLAKVHVTIQKSPSANRLLVRGGGALAALFVVAFFVFSEWRPQLPFAPVHDAVATVLFLGMILGFASGNAALQYVFTANWLVVLGESSYGLYLIHAPLYQLLIDLHCRPTHIFFVLYLLGAIALSVVSFYYFETPARLAILRYLHTRSRESQAEASIAQ
jgi:peptidoglycan/LPS O-acetylase OafA/YrhL